MTVVEFASAFLDEDPVAVLVTDAELIRPGPRILYANAAFGRLTGRDPAEVVGLSPRFMQGKDTRRTSLNEFHRAMKSGARFHGFLTNYRADGTRYRVEIDCRPWRGPSEQVFAFIAFQREVVRRVGRPASGGAGRYALPDLSNDQFSTPLRKMKVFAAD
jgi:PAS domain S-box-containing protein